MRWEWYQTSLQGAIQRGWYQTNFLVSGEFDPGTTPLDFRFAYFPDYLRLFQWSMGLGGPGFYGYWTINLESGLKQTREAMPATGFHHEYQPDIALGAAIHLYTDTHDRTGTARVHWPFMYREFMDGSHTSSEFRSNIPTFVEYYTSTWTWAGVSFRPCVWSRKTGKFQPITRVDVGRTVFSLRKRRPKWAKINEPIDFPTIW